MRNGLPSKLVWKATLGGLVHDLGKPWSQVYKWAHAPLGASLLRDATGNRFSFLQELALAHHGSPDVVERGGDVLRYTMLGDRLSAGERDERYDEDGSPGQPLLLNPFDARGERLVAPGPLADSSALLVAPPTGADPSREFDKIVEWQRQALRQAVEYAGAEERWLVEHLVGAVENSTGLVPSAFWHDMADIALASHLHFAGAFAGALAAGNVSPDLNLETYDGAIGTLVLGDLSGIQGFLHRVASKRAARSLRARSFYLSVLSLVLSRALAQRLGVTSANVLSSVGGNFLVLGPPGCEERIEEVAAELDAALAKVHGAALSVSVAWTLVRFEDTRDFSRVLTELRRRLRDAKARRAEHTAARLGLFEPRGSGGPLKACRSCGGDASDGEDEGEERVCRFCQSLEELGRQLPEASYLILEDSHSDGGPEWQRVARRLGVALTLQKDPPRAPVAGAVYALSAEGVQRVKCARLLPSGRYVPIEQGEVLDFRALAERAKGRPLLAVLKADVDDLGRTFATHFQRNGRSVQSPSRVATFMRFLSLFFEGRVNDLAEHHFPQLYVVFAGGDDLAVVGPWNDILEFARRIREEFREWTAGNPNFHFSAGIAFGDATRPVMAALQEAEALLGEAKNRPGKDAVALFDAVLPWEHFTEMLDWYEELTALVQGARQGEGVARSLLQRLKRLDALTEPRAGKVLYGPELWRAYYSLRRFAERYKKAAQDIERIYNNALAAYGGLKLAMAARLAELATTETRRDV